MGVAALWAALDSRPVSEYGACFRGNDEGPFDRLRVNGGFPGLRSELISVGIAYLMHGKFLQGLASSHSHSCRGSAGWGVFCAFGRDGGPGSFRNGDRSANCHSNRIGKRNTGRGFAVDKPHTGWGFIIGESDAR